MNPWELGNSGGILTGLREIVTFPLLGGRSLVFLMHLATQCRKYVLFFLLVYYGKRVVGDSDLSWLAGTQLFLSPPQAAAPSCAGEKRQTFPSTRLHLNDACCQGFAHKLRLHGKSSFLTLCRGLQCICPHLPGP